MNIAPSWDIEGRELVSLDIPKTDNIHRYQCNNNFIIRYIVAILKFLSHLVFEFNAPIVRKDKSGSNMCTFLFCMSSHSAVHPRY